MNGDAFLAYVEHVLVPELQPGDVVNMDSDNMFFRYSKSMSWKIQAK